jgi:hypothetical protein
VSEGNKVEVERTDVNAEFCEECDTDAWESQLLVEWNLWENGTELSEHVCVSLMEKEAEVAKMMEAYAGVDTEKMDQI